MSSFLLFDFLSYRSTVLGYLVSFCRVGSAHSSKVRQGICGVFSSALCLYCIVCVAVM